MKKTFILDTNVILHDHLSITQFEENDIVIPIEVLEELDNFKKGNSQMNYNAREFLREIDRLTGDKIFNGGISLGEGKGKLKIALNTELPEKLKISFSENKPDHRILGVASEYQDQFPNEKVVLVSKDVNLRVKAKSIGINSEDYESDKIDNVEDMIRGINHLEINDNELVANLYKSKKGVALNGSKEELKLVNNQFFILNNGQSSVLARYYSKDNLLKKIVKKTASGIKPRNAEQTFALEVLLDPNILLVSLTGKAGTGKTLLALAAALEQRSVYEQILLARPIIALSNKEIGFLPGDQFDKTKPYMQPLFDNLAVIKHQFNKTSKDAQKIDQMIEKEELVIAPLAFIRGRSLSNTFFIIDEAQNLTPHEVKTIITRAGEGTKLVFCGDIHQIDSPYLDSQSNGLSYFTDRMKGQDLFAHINLIKGERSYLSELASDLL
ncbi:MAG TPA: ribonuclease [Saprospirales bacterium]|nr:ribonuclease [Saprospirales bacterium]